MIHIEVERIHAADEPMKLHAQKAVCCSIGCLLILMLPLSHSLAFLK